MAGQYVHFFSENLIKLDNPRNNRKCIGERDTTRNIPLSTVPRFPRYILCYISENRLPLGQCSAMDRMQSGYFVGLYIPTSPDLTWPGPGLPGHASGCLQLALLLLMLGVEAAVLRHMETINHK